MLLFGVVVFFFFQVGGICVCIFWGVQNTGLQFCLDNCACTVSAAERGDSPHNPVWVYRVFFPIY